MSPENAELVNYGLLFLAVGYSLLVFQGKIPVKRSSDFIEKYKRILIGGCILVLGYAGFMILRILLHWK